MSKIRSVLHIMLIIAITSASVSGIELEKNNMEYMSASEAEKNYSDCFYYEVAKILESIGTITEFNDKYGADSNEVVEGVSVAQLKEEYYNDYSLDEYESILGNIFYYNIKELDSAGGYFSEDEMYYDSVDIDKYGYSSYEEYNKAYEHYSKLVDFFYDYEEYNDAEYIIEHHVSNLNYVVRYTDENGNVIQYPSNYMGYIEENPELFNSSFLYDKANDTALINGLDKTHAEFDTLVYKCKTFTDYNDFYALFAVDNTYSYNDEFYYYSQEVVTDETQMTKHNMIIVIFVVSIAVAILMLLVLAFLTGRDSKVTNKTYMFDRLWWDILGAIIFIGAIIVAWIFEVTSILDLDNDSDYLYIQIYFVVMAEILAIYMLSLVRRMKAKIFLKSSIIGKIIIKAHNIAKRLWATLPATKKAVICFITTLIYLCLLTSVSVLLFYYEIMFLLLIWFVLTIGLTAGVFYVVWKFYAEYNQITEETKKIAEGDITNKIIMPAKFKSNKNMADAVNSIGEGISKAVEENVKNERMKTDLITNVSHDIKTPLTSIINYVNLLKMENIEDEKIKNYIQILEDKSNRLKVLTDDLVEASKLSSGVIKLDKVKLNLAELIRQSAGEFEEKFEEKCLEIVMNLPMAPVYVNGDGRKMWRVLENLYGNIYKYALKGTRVYVDLATVNGKVLLTVKNISNSPLNFQSNELTERFIRGDVSRSTEGSGLGLSIAKSIIDRHGGEFKIVLDGDLFKIVIKLDEYNEDKEVKLNENK